MAERTSRTDPTPSKRALVTGGSGAIGSAIARRLGSLGFHVLVHGLQHSSRAYAIADDIRADGGRADALSFDVTDFNACRTVLAELGDEPPIQVVVHAAGFYRDGPMAGMSAESWNAVIDVALKGFFNVTQPLLLPMIRSRWGRIIAVTSVSGILGNRGQVNYSAAKAGLHGATKALALELGSRGITVNAVAPGLIATPETDRQFDAETVHRLVPLRRKGTPEDIAGAVAYLVSDAGAYVSGQVLSVNGAMG
ncbi:3-ketoacyl-ACP reductase [Nitrospira sp.]|nr:3-ketoacyl-ACP reductase [Nitrospira sp.]